jgi:hypothetical protein
MHCRLYIHGWNEQSLTIKISQSTYMIHFVTFPARIILPMGDKVRSGNRKSTFLQPTLRNDIDPAL